MVRTGSCPSAPSWPARSAVPSTPAHPVQGDGDRPGRPGPRRRGAAAGRRAGAGPTLPPSRAARASTVRPRPRPECPRPDCPRPALEVPVADPRFVDVSGVPVPGEPEYWEPIIFRRAEIDAESATAGRPARPRRRPPPRPARPPPGRRAGPRPGARHPGDAGACCCPASAPARSARTSTQVGFCIGGGGRVVIDGADRRTSTATTCGTTRRGDLPLRQRPPTSCRSASTTPTPPLLEKLERPPRRGRPDGPPAGPRPRADDAEPVDARGTQPVRHLPAHDDGASLMPYETLINPPAVASRALHWPWLEVKAHLDKLDALGDNYVGRRLYLLYNPRDRADQRHHAELLRHDDHPPAGHRRPAPPPRLGGHQLLLPRLGLEPAWPGSATSGAPAT